MARPTVAQVVEVFRQVPLLDARQLAEVEGNLPPESDDASALVQGLLERGWLTGFQAERLLQKRGLDLQVGPYVCLECLGQGGMGEVYKACHQFLNRVVALKVTRKDKHDDPTNERRLLREIQTTARLSHPNIVVAQDAGLVGDAYVFAMEFIEGTDLNRLVKNSGPLPVTRACDYVRQAALGLQHAFEQGVVHRDIKPSNLLVTADGSQVKITDMGLVRLVDGGGLTETGSVLGTPDYLAPEQATNSRDVDSRADLYSLGCTLYFLLAGQVPFPDGTALEKVFKHLDREPTPLGELRPEVPAQVEAIVTKLMAKRPEDRYQQPAELARALEPFCQASAEPEAPPTGALRKSELVRRPSAVAGQARAAAPGPSGAAGGMERQDSALAEDSSRPTLGLRKVIRQEPATPGPGADTSPPSEQTKTPPVASHAPANGIGAEKPTAAANQAVTPKAAGPGPAPAPAEPAPATAAPAAPAPPAPVERTRWFSRRRLVLATALCLGLASIGSLIWQPWNFSAEPDRSAPLINSIGLALVWIPPGAYGVTTPREEQRPAQASPRQVTIARGFYVSAEPITVEQFHGFVEKTRFRTEAEKDGKGALRWSESRKKWDQDPTCTWSTPGRPQANHHPVVCVSRFDALSFCYWLSRLEKKNYRLPTDDEWDAVFDNDLLARRDGHGSPNAVARKSTASPSRNLPRQFPFGFWEWCTSASAAAPELGLWCSDRKAAGGADGPARRRQVPPGLRGNDTGFRVVLEAGVR